MNEDAVAARSRSMAVPEAIVAVSGRLLRVEHRAIQALMFLLSALILLNVVTRYTGYPIYWIDESAVYSVVWLTFIGASAMTRMRLDFAVTMLTERFSERGAAIFRVIATLGVVLFGISLGVMCWLWLDPVGIAQAGFDAKEFAAGSFNFIYTERTQTLNWPTWVIYLIMPIFALSMTLHALANLFEDLGLVAKQELPGFAANADGVVN
ncbi:TRAP transporter small permease [Bosea sp. (in: a-proteobacteria)]|jgi:TRAP-type C4-dicarboxylate transport system permease small subunit|uniref:TRAP transporter small permease n=1 Tax=Bosea sp. (in: a-proteobacteria) TaxID=1871050 RepID=UPI002DDD8E87|nr:TRAP transporter small permease [Bosea sp. (in: a-proteobacteria)]HEV2513488.1 TRAP transporter small permease [Bosea sp. (in: a-proteobacteria)]